MGKNRCERMGKPQMDKESLDMIYEIDRAFQERREKRFISVILTLIVILCLSNIAWLYSWLQYDYSSEQSVSMDCSDGIATYVGGDGSVSYGEDKSN